MAFCTQGPQEAGRPEDPTRCSFLGVHPHSRLLRQKEVSRDMCLGGGQSKDPGSPDLQYFARWSLPQWGHAWGLRKHLCKYAGRNIPTVKRIWDGANLRIPEHAWCPLSVDPLGLKVREESCVPATQRRHKLQASAGLCKFLQEIRLA